MKKYFASILLLLTAAFAPAQIISGSFMIAGYIHSYDLHLPAGYQPGQHYPLVLDFHYLGADGRDEDSLTQFNPIADAEGFIVCHPNGGQTNWEVGQYAPYHAYMGEVEFIRQLIDTLDARYGVDQSRVYGVGMGQGGFMVQRLACEMSDRFAAMATVGASIHDSAAYYCHGNRAVPFMMIHGTADSVVEYYTGLAGVWRSVPDLLDFWKMRDTCTPNPVTTNLPDLVQEGSTIVSQRWNCASGSQVLHYQVVGGGFSWPGASRDLGSGGNRNMDINASQHIWDFFAQFTLTGPTSVGEPNTATAFQAFPQPAQNVVHIEAEKLGKSAIVVLDLQGRVLPVEIERPSPREATAVVAGLPDGIYLLRVGNATQRLIVQH